MTGFACFSGLPPLRPGQLQRYDVDAELFLAGVHFLHRTPAGKPLRIGIRPTDILQHMVWEGVEKSLGAQFFTIGREVGQQTPYSLNDAKINVMHSPVAFSSRRHYRTPLLTPYCQELVRKLNRS